MAKNYNCTYGTEGYYRARYGFDFTKVHYKSQPKPSNKTTNTYKPKNVIFNGPATIAFWEDGTKTVVKCEGEDFDKEKGSAMAIAKKALGNKGNYFEVFKKWCTDDDEESDTYESNIFDSIRSYFAPSSGDLIKTIGEVSKSV